MTSSSSWLRSASVHPSHRLRKQTWIYLEGILKITVHSFVPDYKISSDVLKCAFRHTNWIWGGWCVGGLQPVWVSRGFRGGGPPGSSGWATAAQKPGEFLSSRGLGAATSVMCFYILISSLCSVYHTKTYVWETLITVFHHRKQLF